MTAQPDVKSAPAATRTVRLLNVRLLVASVAATVLLAAALSIWHRHQSQRTAGALLKRATNLESQEEWGKAADYIERYLRRRPDDRAARVRLAHTFDKATAGKVNGNGRAIELYYQALPAADDTEQFECRRRLAELLLAADRYEESLEQSKLLLIEFPQHVDALRLRALALYRGQRRGVFADKQRSPSDVFESLAAAWQSDTSNAELATALAFVYREMPELLPPTPPMDQTRRETAADQTMAELIASSADVPAAYVRRHMYRVKYGLDGADEDIERSVALSPDNIATRVLAGRYWTDNVQRSDSNPPHSKSTIANLDRAAAHFQHIIAHVDSKNEAAYVGLGEVFALKNEAEAAVSTWEAGAKELQGNSWVLNVRLAEAYTDVGDVEKAAQYVADARNLSDYLDERSKIIANSFDRLLQLLEAQVQVRSGNLAEAERQLRRISTQSDLNSSERARAQRAWMALGKEHVQRGFWERAAIAFEKAAQLQPSSPSPRLSAAVARHRAHQFDLAIPHYRELLSFVDSTELWLALAKARFERTLLLPERERQWQPVRDALLQAKNRARHEAGDPANNWQLSVLEAELIAAGGDESTESTAERNTRVIQILAGVEEAYPDSPELYARLALLYERLGQSEAADRAAQSLHRITSADSRWQLVQAQLEAYRGRHAAAKRLLRLKDGAANAELLRMMAGVCASDGDADGVRTALESLYRLEPWSLEIPVQLAELAIQRADFEAAARWQDELARHGDEGQGPALYCASLTLIAQAKSGDDPRVTRARDLFRKIERLRPFWPPTYSLKGQLHELEGGAGLAIDAYKHAVDLGDQRAWVLQKLVVLLNRLRRFEEADAFLAKLQSTGNLLAVLEIPRFTADEKGALLLIDSAERAVERSPQDARARIWYGHLLLQMARQSKTDSERHFTEARRQFEAATSLAPRDSDAWNGLFTFYLSREQPDEARRTLFELVNRCQLQGGQRAFVLAQGFELLGDAQAAFEQYKLALQQSTERPTISLRMARLAARSDPEFAERILRELLKESPDASDARLALASLLATSGEQQRFEEAMSLLAHAGGQRDLAETLRVKAALLLERKREPAAARLEARDALKSLLAHSEQASAGDLLLMAQVCDRLFDWQTARRHYLAAASSADATPQMLQSCVDFLLRQGDLNEADRWLTLLEGRVNEGPRTLTLRARWLRASGRESEIGPAVETFASDMFSSLTDRQEQISFCQSIGQIYAKAQSPELAESWHRRLLKLDSASYGALALCLAMQRPPKIDEAIRICLDAADEDDATAPAITLANVLVAANAPRVDDPQVQALISKAINSAPEDVTLLNAVANLDVIRGDYQSAVQRFESVIRQQPDDALVLNNLAVLLAGLPDRKQDAEKYLSSALRISGEAPELLDTHSVLLLVHGKPREAIERLQKAVSLGHDTPVVRFHLVAAYEAAGMSDEARQSFNELNMDNLPSQLATPVDKSLLAHLLNQFGRVGVATGAEAL